MSSDVFNGRAWGRPRLPGSARQIKPNDWPYFGSIVKMLKPSERLPALTSVWLPDVMRLNDNVTPAGQTAGFTFTCTRSHARIASNSMTP